MPRGAAKGAKEEERCARQRPLPPLTQLVLQGHWCLS